MMQSLRRENEALRAELAQRNEMRWISVEDKLPERSDKPDQADDVLLYIPPRDGCRQRGTRLGKLCPVEAGDGNKNFWNVPTAASDWTVWGWSYFEEPVVTHWMPLPSAPKED